MKNPKIREKIKNGLLNSEKWSKRRSLYGNMRE
jgi:hypothetical protein